MDTPVFTTPTEALEWVHKVLGSILDHDPITDGDKQHGMRQRVRAFRKNLRQIQKSQY